MTPDKFNAQQSIAPMNDATTAEVPQVSRRRFMASAVALAVGAVLGRSAFSEALAADAVGPAEKPQLTLGFIKLTDMAPLAIAYEKGFFEDEGLFVSLQAQANWKVLLDGVIGGSLDGAHMLAGQPLAATIGFGSKAHLVTPYSMDLNGNAITVSNSVWQQMLPELPKMPDGKPVHPISASYLKPIVEDYKKQGKLFKMGMVFPVSTHNYYLRYWLAAGGLNPGFYDPGHGDTNGQIDAQVLLSVTPPPQMPSTLQAGTIDGYCVGEPWNEQAIMKGIGVPIVTDLEIWKNNPEKVFGLTDEFTKKYPNTTIRLVKALIRAGHWLDENNNANRKEAVKILAKSQYVGADEAVIAKSMTGTFEFDKGDVRPVPDFNVFFRDNATYPYYSDAIWFLTQMRRWGQIGEEKPDDWYLNTAKSVYKPDIYQKAALALIAEGKFKPSQFPDFATETGFKPVTDTFIDKVSYDGHTPNAYLAQFKIGLKGNEMPKVGGV